MKESSNLSTSDVTPSNDAQASQDLYQVFISSPGDVNPERLIAHQVVDRMAREFKYHFDIKPVLWERMPLTATEPFQTSIDPPPSKTQVVVVILWMRLGSPMPLDKFPGPKTGKQVTGTEWEFEEAVLSYEKKGTPDILLYRKEPQAVPVWLDDEEKLNELRTQKQNLEKFLQYWGFSKGTSNVKASFTFSDTASFAELLEEHLREYFKALLAGKVERRTEWYKGSPFRGLEPFEIEHSEVFFGRLRARNELRELLVRRADAGIASALVLGASGSGKSSLVKAGLLPDIKLPGMVKGVGEFRIAIMKPSDAQRDLFLGLSDAILERKYALFELLELGIDRFQLREKLADRKTASAPIQQALERIRKERLTEYASARLAIVVDQLEELFTHNFPEADRRAFIETLNELACSGLVWVIATMRSDFYDSLATIPLLAKLAREASYLLTSPTSGEIRDIILRPAREAGLVFETRLETGEKLDEVLAQAAMESPYSLPLLEFTLEQLWQKRDKTGQLTFQAYKKLGGMKGAISVRAEDVFRGLPDEVKATFPGILRALVTVKPGKNAEPIARTVPLKNFPEGSPQRLLTDAFLDPKARLLVAEDTQVRVTHEALLKTWKRASEQIERDRTDLLIRARLERQAAEWREESDEYGTGMLLRGLPLSEARDLMERRHTDLDLKKTTIRYIKQSIKAAEDQAAREKEEEYQRRRAEESAQKAALREKAQRASILLPLQPLEGLMSAIISTDDNLTAFSAEGMENQVEASLREAVELARELTVIRVHALSVAFNPDGQSVATGGADGVVRFWDRQGQQTGMPLSGQEYVLSMAFSPDGQVIATGGTDGPPSLWRLDDTRIRAPMETCDVYFLSVAFSPSGEIVACGDDDGMLRLWNWRTGHVTQWSAGHNVYLQSVAFSPDGQLIAAGRSDGILVISDLEGNDRTTFSGHEDAILSVAFSPDGRTVVSGSADQTVRIWDREEGPKAKGEGHRKRVNSVAVSPSGHTIVSGSADGTLRLWNLKGESTGITLVGHEDGIGGVAFSPDAEHLASVGFDGTLRIWDWRDRFELQIQKAHRDDVNSVAVSPDGIILSVGADKRLRFWKRSETKGLAELLVESRHDGFVRDMAVSADGKLIVTGGADGLVRLWNQDGTPAGTPFSGHNMDIYSVACAPDAQIIASGDANGTVFLWDRTGKKIKTIEEGNKNGVRSIAFSPHGDYFVTGGADKTIRLWDCTGQDLGLPFEGHQDSVYCVAVGGPDGDRIASASADRTLRLWDKQGNLLSPPLRGHEDEVIAVAFSPNGKLLVSGSSDHTVRLWFLGDTPIGLALRGHTAKVESVAFSPDGAFIISGSADGIIRMWQGGDWQSWLKLACERAYNHPMVVNREIKAAEEACLVCEKQSSRV